MPLWKLEDSLHLGDVIKPHSYLGFVKVAFLFPGLEKIVKPGSFIFIEFMEKPVPFFIENIQWADDTSALLKFEEVNSDKDAEELRGRKLVIASASIPKKQQKRMQPASSFEGYSIKDETGRFLGTVTEVMESGPQSLLEVEYEKSTYLIPVHEDIIIDVILQERLLIVNLPEGLISVNN
jgi:16S rRNA processing protein RimM